MNKKKVALGAIIGVAVGILVSILATDAIIATGHAEFCASCHSMKGVVKAFKEDVHGGNNSVGFVAECTDCHLPHNSTMGFVIAKGIAGIKDVWGEMTIDHESFDWNKNRERRESFVYDSGCLKCHIDLEEKTLSNKKAILPHKNYFIQSVELKCATCHKHVGHSNLMHHISLEKKR